MRFSKPLHLLALLILPLVLLLVAAWLPINAHTSDANMQALGLQTGAYTQTLIEATDGASGDAFGDAVALNGDLLAVGAIYVRLNGQSAGAVYLFERDPQAPSGWTEIHKLYGDPGLVSPYFGYALALQGDTLVVGAPFHPRNGSIQGKVTIYERHQGGTDQWGLVTELADEEDGDGRWFGRSVALDGDLVAVSAVGAEDDRGKVYLYSRAAGWARVKDLSDPDGQERDWFGSALALQGDTLVVGAQAADFDATTTDTGAAFVFERDQGGAGQWGLLTRIVADAPLFDSFFGNAVALDGDTIAVGAYNEDRYEAGQQVASQVGAAYVFGRDEGGPNAWGQLAELRPADGATLERFGTSLALTGDDLWIGAPGRDTGGFGDEGALFHYSRDEGGANAWGMLSILGADPDSTDAAFGTALAVEGNTLLAGAPEHETKGAAYVIVPHEAPGTASASSFLPLALNNWTPPTGILNDGGSLESSSGAIIGAVPGTLDAPLEATIVETRSPAESMPGGFLPRGDHYRLAAEDLAITPDDKPFLVGLPVPNTADTSKLAVAAYVPDGLSSESEIPEAPTRSWTTAQGSYDPATNLFVITLRALLPEGVTLVLYEHPQNAPLPAPTVGARQPAQIEYNVTCDPAAQHTDVCSEGYYLFMSDELEAAHHEFVDTFNFRPPALVHAAGVFVGPDKEPQLNQTYYGALIASRPCTNAQGDPIRGQYSYLTLQILVCFDELGDTDEVRRVLRHELFHAIQASYANLADDRLDSYYAPRTHWMVEGTAAASERSGFIMLRTPDWDLREVTQPLTSTVDLTEYEMQDFWVYTGLEGDQSDHYLSYLRGIFERGATPEHAAQGMDLADAYWSWVKNQAIEHHQTMIASFESGPCELEDAAVDPDLINIIDYPAEIRAEGQLGPMSTALVEIRVHSEDVPSRMPVNVTNDTNPADLLHKVYVEREPGCKDRPDGDRILENVPPSTKRYVLISNVSLTDPFNYAVTVD